MQYSFDKTLYSKIALLKSAYNFTDVAYIHLKSDENKYYVDIHMKPNHETISEEEFINEMLAQAVRHEVFLQTKNIRELLLARAMSTSVIAEVAENSETAYSEFSEDEILKDWFDENE